MTKSSEFSIEYVAARRALLDALDAIGPQIGAVTLIGAQAVYLRTIGRLATYQPYTTDADLVLDPEQLADIPALGDALRQAGFILTSEPGVWEARLERDAGEQPAIVPVDLIVPESIAPTAGRRSARLPTDTGGTPPARLPVLKVRSLIADRLRLRRSISPTSDVSSLMSQARPLCW